MNIIKPAAVLAVAALPFTVAAPAAATEAAYVTVAWAYPGYPDLKQPQPFVSSAPGANLHAFDQYIGTPDYCGSAYQIDVYKVTDEHGASWETLKSTGALLYGHDGGFLAYDAGIGTPYRVVTPEENACPPEETPEPTPPVVTPTPEPTETPTPTPAPPTTEPTPPVGTPEPTTPPATGKPPVAPVTPPVPVETATPAPRATQSTPAETPTAAPMAREGELAYTGSDERRTGGALAAGVGLLVLGGLIAARRIFRRKESK